MKLFQSTHEIFDRTEPYMTRKGVAVDVEEFIGNMQEYEALEVAIEAYDELATLMSTVLRNTGDINNSSVALYNRQVAQTMRSLGLDSKRYELSVESHIEGSVKLTHSQLDMEGFIGDLWEKIKAIFKRIIEGIKKFYNRYMTEVGHLKGQLEKIRKTLSNTNNDLVRQQAKIVPSTIKRHYAGTNTVNSSYVKEVHSSADHVLIAMSQVNNDAEKFMSSEVMKPSVWKKLTTKKSEGDKLESKFSDDKLEDGQSDALKTTGGALLEDRDNTGQSAFKAGTIQKLNALKGKKMVNGKVLESASEEDGTVKLNWKDEDTEPQSLMLGNKSVLLGLVEGAIKLIDESEKERVKFAKINDNVMKAFDAIDGALRTVDKQTGNTKDAQLQRVVKSQMDSLKTFLQSYSGLGQGLLGSIKDTCKGDLAYAKESIRYFGDPSKQTKEDNK